MAEKQSRVMSRILISNSYETTYSLWMEQEQDHEQHPKSEPMLDHLLATMGNAVEGKNVSHIPIWTYTRPPTFYKWEGGRE